MRQILSTGLMILLASAALALAADNAPLLMPTVSPSPSDSSTKLTDREKSRLLSEFKKSMNTEMAALRHRQGLELKELKASQEARRKEWKDKENAHRRELFQTSIRKPADRQAYFKDRNARWKAFDRILVDEYTQRKSEQEVRMRALTEEHAQKLKDFEAAIRRGERPPASLWPRGNS